ncbi:MAG: hypothetical protein ACFCA4_13970 [Cyanophyceae cyanobacterium]
MVAEAGQGNWREEAIKGTTKNQSNVESSVEQGAGEKETPAHCTSQRNPSL